MVLSHLFFRYHPSFFSSFFFFNDTATTEIYTLSLHDALPILFDTKARRAIGLTSGEWSIDWRGKSVDLGGRSEEHTSELQSRLHLVCRLLLEKKKITSSEEEMEDSDT